MAVRSRYAEDERAQAVACGVRQYVVLGAGLDTFAYRNIFRDVGLRVFEVDHPATQEWKRQRLAAAGIAIPPEASFVAVDFERQQLPDTLYAGGYRPSEPAFFSWLGVVPYLTATAFQETLAFIASLPHSRVVFDYGVAKSALNFLEKLALDVLSARASECLLWSLYDNYPLMKLAFVVTVLLSPLTHLSAAEPPTAKIANGPLRVQIYLPDLRQGFYRGTRFDWSGVIYSLQFQGHEYYGPWFNKTSPAVHDFIYEGSDIIAGPCSAITGPVDEFGPLGWDNTKPGGTFLKIGVGALRKPDDAAYDNYRLYEIANPGKWTISKKQDSIEFVQTLNDSSSGYGYIYRKDLRLRGEKAEMVLSHSLKNTGTRAIETNVYNHNFLVLDGRTPGPGVSVSVPFQIGSPRPPDKRLAEIRGKQIVYLETLTGRDTVATPLEGFGQDVADHQIRIENAAVGAGMTIRSDRPLAKESLWSIRTVIAMEPFVSITIEPGAEFTWKATYEYYLVSAK